jgi:hypothetical protein
MRSQPGEAGTKNFAGKSEGMPADEVFAKARQRLGL